ncbi:MAG: energy-dependent translational throttle protein EttA [Proteobacteria bacterium]|nr:energy-dependent translational throttle protein EttA [Pseudomonadota bacterium]
MTQYVYNMVNLRKIYPPNKEVLKGIYLSFLPGAKIGVLGLNGSGKSTLLKVMAGIEKNFQGEAFPAPGLKIGYLAQEPELDSTRDVLGNVELAVKDQKALLARFEELSMKMCEPLSDDEMNKVIDEQGKVQNEIDAKNLWELDRHLEIAMDALRLPPSDADVKVLSGGEKRRVALCRLLLEKPEMLILDEPTNHLDAESVAWLERYLHDYPGTVVAVTHDRYFLDNVAGWILELDRGAGIPWQGNYSSWLDQKAKRLATEEKQESARRRALTKELEWVRQSAKARQAKSKARLQAYEEMAAQEAESYETINEIKMPPAPRLGDLVVEAKGISKGFGDKLLFENLSFNFPKGAIVGIIGPNGAGKSTLFKMIGGFDKADSGDLRLGDTVKIAYVDQSRDSLDGDKSVYDELSEGEEIFEWGRQKIASRAYVASFGFRGTDQQKKVGVLSGGERNRLNLAKSIKRGGNLLLLDEPTNDLDVDTLRALEDAVLNFSGCVCVISHDRWFLDRIATHILAFEGDSQVVWFEGNYQDYEVDRKRRLGMAADQPHRIKYKPLTR